MDPNDLIDRLGGTCATAALCEVTKGAVSQWRRNGIPAGWRKYLRAVRPDVFANAPAAPLPSAQDRSHVTSA